MEVFLGYHEMVVVNSSTFINCTDTGDGRAIYMFVGPPIITNYTFSGNLTNQSRGNDILKLSNNIQCIINNIIMFRK
jgi:hypothetical protein